MRTIDWFEDDGCMGGQRGLEIDFKKKIITKWNGVEEAISKDNIDDVYWCMDMNEKELLENNIKMTKRLNQTETIKTKLYDANGNENGFSLSEPLNPRMRDKYEYSLELNNSDLLYLKQYREQFKEQFKK